ncbi:putative reverse transcriptase domain-containing protein [Tanacetum coccineum]
MVNHEVSYQVDVRSRESSEFHSRHHDAQKDRAAVRAKIEVLRRERLAYEQESMETRQALARSEAYCRALEARVTVLETEVRRHEWQRQAADDFVVRHIMRTQALEAGARVDTLEDTGPRPAQAVRECSYSELLKCKALDFKGTEGVVGLTRWFEKIESLGPLTPETASCHAMAKAKKIMMIKYARGMFPEEIDKIEKYIGGLPDPCYAERQAERKRMYDDLSKNNQNQQQQNKRHNTCQAYTAGNSDRKPYAGGCKCPKNNNNNNNNNRNNNNNNQKGNGCYECGAQGHFRRNCPKLRNNDRGNQAGNDRAPAKVYVVGNAGANPDNVVAELGSFAIIGMDWLAKYQAVIVCAEKIVRIP